MKTDTVSKLSISCFFSWIIFCYDKTLKNLHKGLSAQEMESDKWWVRFCNQIFCNFGTTENFGFLKNQKLDKI